MSEVFVHNGVEYTLPSPKGLVFESVAANYQLLVRPRRPIYDSGILIGEEKELVADFGDQTPTIYHDDDTGEEWVNTRGHFIDTLVQGRQKEWTDDERMLVEKKLLAYQRPDDHWLHTKPPVGRPWPTYDKIPADQIAPLAADLGLVAEAISYERENENRQSVLDALSSAQTVAAPVGEEIGAV